MDLCLNLHIEFLLDYVNMKLYNERLLTALEKAQGETKEQLEKIVKSIVAEPKMGGSTDCITLDSDEESSEWGTVIDTPTPKHPAPCTPTSSAHSLARLTAPAIRCDLTPPRR